ncbi:MAG: LacI family DNA-binding transcriptional regulator, partial [Bacteroidales bacterium]
MKRHLTLKDIATHMGLSVSTVSRALRDDATIGLETRQKIKEYAHQHHYQPNSLAANLRKKESNIIGVIIPEISNQFFSLIIAGMESIAEVNNYSLIITQSNEEYAKEVRCVHSLLSARVAGILVSLSKTTEEYSHFEEIIHTHVPLVFFDRICTGVLTDKVVVTDYQGAFKAVEYLIRTGCRRIAYFGSDSNLEIAKNRKL